MSSRATMTPPAPSRFIATWWPALPSMACRPSWVRLDRVLDVPEEGIRREGAILDRVRFDTVAVRLRAEYSWHGPTGASAALTSALRNCQRVRFEVTEDASGAEPGQRYAFTPTLGVFHAVTDAHGEIQIGEQRLRTAMLTAQTTQITLPEVLGELLGEPWDAELEVFRYAGQDAPVRWLHRVG